MTEIEQQKRIGNVRRQRPTIAFLKPVNRAAHSRHQKAGRHPGPRYRLRSRQERK